MWGVYSLLDWTSKQAPPPHQSLVPTSLDRPTLRCPGTIGKKASHSEPGCCVLPAAAMAKALSPCSLPVCQCGWPACVMASRTHVQDWGTLPPSSEPPDSTAKHLDRLPFKRGTPCTEKQEPDSPFVFCGSPMVVWQSQLWFLTHTIKADQPLTSMSSLGCQFQWVLSAHCPSQLMH